MLDSFVVDGTQLPHDGPPQRRPPRRRARRASCDDVEKIVRYENSVFGPPPLEQYTFLFNIGYRGGDGMEHLYSTQIINAHAVGGLDSPCCPGITTAAHEYFHVWNVKRVRPAALGPFDYTREQYQPSLWVAEGWTQYYGQTALGRVGHRRHATRSTRRWRGLDPANLTAPGRKEVSARMASFHAPFWDGARAAAAEQRIADLLLATTPRARGSRSISTSIMRAKTEQPTLARRRVRSLKRRSWNAPNASYYLQGRATRRRDVERAASEVAGEDMHGWFERYVGGTEDLDYDALLARAGLRLVRGERWTIEELPDATPAQLVVRGGGSPDGAADRRARPA